VHAMAMGFDAWMAFLLFLALGAAMPSVRLPA
jgi:hypothetical protein